jgi:hypothetical protein
MWKWGDQGGNGKGTITGKSDTQFWVSVTWDNGGACCTSAQLHQATITTILSKELFRRPVFYSRASATCDIYYELVPFSSQYVPNSPRPYYSAARRSVLSFETWVCQVPPPLCTQLPTSPNLINAEKNAYRMGDNGSYDLKVVSGFETEDAATPGSVSRPDIHSTVGRRVKRGPDWKWGAAVVRYPLWRRVGGGWSEHCVSVRMLPLPTIHLLVLVTVGSAMLLLHCSP